LYADIAANQAPLSMLQDAWSNTRGFFGLLRGNEKAYMQPKQFICPSAISVVNHRPSGPTVDVYNAAGGSYQRYDFNGNITETGPGVPGREMATFSYSFQMTMRRRASGGEYGASDGELLGIKLTNTVDPRLALAADRNPYSNEVTFPTTRSDSYNSEKLGGLYTFSTSPSTGATQVPPFETTGDDALAIKDLLSTRANSRNHKQEGQNVVYMDGHAKWHRISLAGADEDCIWTNWTDSRNGHRVPATGASYGKMRSRAEWGTDSLLIP